MNQATLRPSEHHTPASAFQRCRHPGKALLALALAACASGGGGRTTGGAAAAGAPGGGGKQIIAPPGANRLAPYSPGVRVGDLIFFSGQIGSRPGAGLSPDFKEQVKQALENLRNLLTAAGVAPRDLVKCTVFLADIADYTAMNEVYGQFFQPDPPPARSAIAVAGLPAGARVEIECIAAVPK